MQLENLGRKNLGISTKSTGIDLVTEIDRQSEKRILEFIRHEYPGHSILAEESGLSKVDSDYTWVIDPLDGTTNYSQGLPIFAISIALQYQKETVLGVVYAPALGQMFTAIRGQGAYMNSEKLKVSAKTTLLESVLATGFPYDIAQHPANNLNYFNQLALKARAVRRLGAAAYDLACVAAGKFDGYWELNLSPWDVAAGILLVEEAGGEVFHFRQDRKISLVAGNTAIVQLIRDEIHKVDTRDARAR
jgi:myo-inositol-1(or 4)-monophosphatase